MLDAETNYYEQHEAAAKNGGVRRKVELNKYRDVETTANKKYFEWRDAAAAAKHGRVCCMNADLHGWGEKSKHGIFMP